MTFKQIKKEVEKTGFGLCALTDKEPYLVFSKGIMLAVQHSEYNDFEEDMAQALTKFICRDFGDFYCRGEYPTWGREYGRYECCLGEYIHIHRESFFHDPSKEAIVIYFQFEQ